MSKPAIFSECSFMAIMALIGIIAIIAIICYQLSKMRRTLGISRNKTSQLSELRRQKRFNKTLNTYAAPRFSKARLAGEIEMVQQRQAMKKPFIEDVSTVSTIEEPKPQWMAYFEECQLLLRAVEDLRREMSVNQNKRLTCIKVSQEKSYELRIYDCAKEATARIKKCEKLVESIKTQALSQLPAHSRVCNTVCFRLATDIQQATKLLRAQQKSFVEQRKQFEMSQKPTFLQLAADHLLNGNEFEQLVQDEVIRELQQRNDQIRKIVQSIYELSDIYKQLGGLVLLQGSLLDRIDSNIEQSRQHVAKGLGHLVSAEKRQRKTGRCACKLMLVLLVLNAILFIVLCVRWFR